MATLKDATKLVKPSIGKDKDKDKENKEKVVAGPRRAPKLQSSAGSEAAHAVDPDESMSESEESAKRMKHTDAHQAWVPPLLPQVPATTAPEDEPTTDAHQACLPVISEESESELAPDAASAIPMAQRWMNDAE
jgi:hypothetical protein